jgi:hypothetical protein
MRGALAGRPRCLHAGGRLQRARPAPAGAAACARRAGAPGARPRAVRARSAVWDDSMTLADLKAQLEQAIDEEDYDRAARIRDTLQ